MKANIIWDIAFSIPGDPKALKRHRNFQRGKFRGTYDPSSGDKQDFLAKAMMYVPTVPYDEPLAVNLNFAFSRPKSHYRTGKMSDVLKDNAPDWHTGTPDADNLAKFVCDAFNGAYWKDDSRISSLLVTKIYSDAPFVSVKIRCLNDII